MSSRACSLARNALRNAKRHLDWHPQLIVPLPVFAVIAAHALALDALIVKATQERLAIPLILGATTVWALRAWRGRERLCVLVACQAAVFACREFHFTGTHRGVYVATGVVAVWGLVWAWQYQEHVERGLTDWRALSWLLASVTSYALALLIQRRAFRFVPGESALHVSLEECTENAAHALLLLSGLINFPWRSKPPARPVDPPDSQV